ncbi:DUF4430 domain-containing protein, partial [Patescibacteria group bacterium]|nr:DUF4430 domain-containing protein [Patescibacteria group bacterium]
QIKFIAFGLIFGIAGFLIGINAFKERALENASILQQDSATTCFVEENFQEQHDVSVMIDTGNDLLGFSSIILEEEDSVSSVLLRLAEQNDALTIDVIDYGNLGVFINSINGNASGDDNKYWQYWVNNEYAQIAADQYILEEGDIILWKFTSSKYEQYE